MTIYQTAAFAALCGVSPRTLRYYHQLGLVVPKLSANGYRQYTSADADRLQQVLMYRTLGFDLAEIGRLLKLSPAQRLASLRHQAQVLDRQQAELAFARSQLDATITNLEGVEQMSDSEKFAAFKQAKLAENDRRYGQEVAERYGEHQKQAADRHYAGLSEAQMAEMAQAEQDLRQALVAYLADPALPSKEEEQAFAAHRTWLQLAAPQYSMAMHRGIGQLYAQDERFAAYYQKLVGDERATAALAAIIDHYTAR